MTLVKNFPETMATTSKVFPKRAFQDILKQCRNQGLTVTKLESGYTVHFIKVDGDSVLLLKAMNGNHGYLARYDARLIS